MLFSQLKISWWAGRWDSGQSGWHSSSPRVSLLLFFPPDFHFPASPRHPLADADWRRRWCEGASTSLWQSRVPSPSLQCRSHCCRSPWQLSHLEYFGVRLIHNWFKSKGIEGVESIVEEFFKENKLPVVKSDIPTVKVLSKYFCFQFNFPTLFRAADTALLTTDWQSLLATCLTFLRSWSAMLMQSGIADLS